ncbi:hypothetical protein D3C76_1560320 [compost metagenome]
MRVGHFLRPAVGFNLIIKGVNLSLAVQLERGFGTLLILEQERFNFLQRMLT